MRAILGVALACLWIPEAGPGRTVGYPTDLSRWLATPSPGPGEDRWWTAYEDSTHCWVVELRGTRPSARLRMPERERRAFGPVIQEAEPRLPFPIEPGSIKEGSAGEWFSAKVKDGWIIGFNKGEWGGALWWYSSDGKTRSRISRDQVSGFLKTEAGLFAWAGCPHGFAGDGKILRLISGGDGRWHSETFVDLKSTPMAATIDPEGQMLVVTYDRLIRINPHTRTMDVVLANAFWQGLHPNSVICSRSGIIEIGMRHGVAEVRKVGAAYRARWLIPDAEYAEAVARSAANRPDGFR